MIYKKAVIAISLLAMFGGGYVIGASYGVRHNYSLTLGGIKGQPGAVFRGKLGKFETCVDTEASFDNCKCEIIK